MPQIEDIKLFNKGMNKDVDPRYLGEGEYIDALNAMPSNYKDGAVHSLTNYPAANIEFDLDALGYTIIGLFKDEHEDQLYIFATNGTTGRIYRHDLAADTRTTPLSTTVLPWTVNTIIKACSVVEDIIIWTDGDNEIGMYDQNISYGTLTADMLTLAQLTPLEEPVIQLLSDTAYRSNNIAGKFLQFKYRFVFKNKMRSTFSPISNVAYSSDDYSSPASLAGKDNTVNAVDVSMSGANANGLVESIEVAARSGNSGDFFLIKKLDADGTFLGGGDQIYRFFNEGLYEPIALKESNQLMDDIPQTANTLEFAGNRVITGDNKNGYDDIDVDYDLEVIYNNSIEPTRQIANTDDAGYLAAYGAATPRTPLESSGGTGGLADFLNEVFGYTTLLAGDKITVIGVDIPSNPHGVDYSNPFGDVTITIEFGETWATLLAKILAPTFYCQYPDTDLTLLGTSSNNAPPPTGNDSFQFWLTQGTHEKTFKSGAWYNVGLQYQDKYGRTNGVQIQENSKVYIKTLGERGLTPDDYTEAGSATIKVTINNATPSWAESVKIVYSRASVYDQSIQTATRGAQNNADSAINVDIDVGCITEWNDEKGGNLAYQWEKGDRVRILTGEAGAANIYTDWAQSLLEAEIVGADSTGGVTTGGYAITIPTLDGLSRAQTVALLNSGATIEIFRPSKELEASKSIYTEANLLPGTSDTITGDAYLKSRDDYPYGTGSDTSNIAFEGYDISDFIESEHYDKGRATAIINQEQSQRFATLMYSEVYIPNTEINQLNRFYPDVNYEEYNKSFGAIILLHNEGDHLLMIQEDKASRVFVDRSLTYDASGNMTVLNTQKRVLSEAVPYAGLFGIQDHKSFVAIGNRRYWLDMARGVVIRLSNNGIETISRYGMRGWFSDMCRTRMSAGELSAYGIYDVQNDMYMINFGTGNTIVFDEKNNAWITFNDFIIPRFGAYINNRSFYADADFLCELNYPGLKNVLYSGGGDPVSASTIKFSSNIEPTLLKNYLAIHLDSTHAMAVEITTDALNGRTVQSSTLVAGDFTEREQEWHASFLRDVNTPRLDPAMSDGDWANRVIFLGDTIKGKHAQIELSLQTSDDLLIRMVKVLVSKG